MLAAKTVSQEEKQKALERALESHTFARSEQLRCFLRFVCEAEFRGATSELTEYVIGTEVLHRPPGYSPAEDSVVRTRAYELRQKLEKLYGNELASDVVHITIPKGAYIPQFVRASAETPQTAENDRLRHDPDQPYRTIGLIVSLVIALLVGAAVSFWIQEKFTSGKGVDPVVAQAWAPFAKPDDNVLLVPSTPLYLVLGPATHGAYGTYFSSTGRSLLVIPSASASGARGEAGDGFHRRCHRCGKPGCGCDHFAYSAQAWRRFGDFARAAKYDVSAPRPRHGAVWGSCGQRGDLRDPCEYAIKRGV
ncbi:MAG: hypothetical protein ACRD22_12280 [Terriglobia bacterium]